MKPRLKPDEARKAWADHFLADFLKLPQGRTNNAKEKKEFLKRVFEYEQDGKVFSIKFLSKLTNLTRATLHYHHKNLQ